MRPCRLDRLVVAPGAYQPPEARGAGHVGALADVDEVGIGANLQSVHAAENGVSGDVRRARARRETRRRVRYRAGVFRSGAAAAADDVRQAALDELAQIRRHAGRRFVVFAELVGQPGVRIAADEPRRRPRHGGEKRAYLVAAQRAVYPHAQQRDMRHGGAERLDRLPRKVAPAHVHRRERGDYGDARADFVEYGFNGVQRRLRVERIEDGFDEQNIRAAVQQPARLLGVVRRQLVERDFAVGGVVHVWRYGQGFVRGPHAAGDETGLARVLFGELACGVLRHLRGVSVQLVNAGFQAELRQPAARGGEGVGGENVRARFEIAPLRLAHHVGLRQNERVDAAAQIAVVIREYRAAIVRLRQIQRLQHHPPRPVHDHDAPFENTLDFGGSVNDSISGRRRGGVHGLFAFLTGGISVQASL